MLVDGKQIADEIYATLKKEREGLARPPRLGIVVGVQDAATEAYVHMKEKVAAQLYVEVRKEVLSADTTTERAINVVNDLCRTQTGVIVQLPLPMGIDVHTVLSAVSALRDVDGLNPEVKEFQRLVRAPIAETIAEILTRMNADIRGTKAVVVGAGMLVGIPAANLLRSRGAKVTVVTLDQGSLEELSDADVVVLGAGSPGLVKPEMLKKGVILIDAGTSEQGGKLFGDATPECAEVASIFTPVPGGVGPITIAMLFKNLFELSRRQ